MVAATNTFRERCDLLAGMNVAMELNRRWTGLNADQAGSPKSGSGKGWKEVERVGTRTQKEWKEVEQIPPYSTSFHVFPPASTLEIFLGETLL